MHRTMIIAFSVCCLLKIASVIHVRLGVFFDLVDETVLILTLQRATHLVPLAGHVTCPRLGQLHLAF